MLNFNFKGNQQKFLQMKWINPSFLQLSSFIKFLIGKMLFLVMYHKKQILFCKDDVVTNKALVLLMGPLHGRLVMDLTFHI